MKINNNIRSTLRVAKIELNTMFYSPVAWLVIFIFVCQVGYSFSEVFGKQLHYQDTGGTLWGVTTGMFTGMYGILSPILRTLYLYIPLITMGLISREYQSGSIKLLYSSPIKNYSIILGKFITMMIYGLVLLAIVIFITIFCTVFVKDFDYPLLLSAILGFYLLILAYSAIGIFMSSITHYQVVAAIGTLALLAGLNYVGGIGQSIDMVRDITYWLSMSNRSYDFLNGLISSEDVIYFILVIVLFLGLSIFKLNTEKTMMSRSRKILGYSTILLAIVGLGYVTSRPQFKFYYDATQDKDNTLALESQQIIRDVKREKGDIKIISYVNILADQYYNGLPSRRIDDKKRFEKYIRFMPGIEMEYVLYYDETTKPSFTAQRFAGEDIRQTAELVCKSDKLDFKKILSPEQFKAQYEDLSAEGNQFIRILETPDGQRAYLRMFNDQQAHPDESEISAALGRFITKPPHVGFYTTNPARQIDNYGDRGFYLFAHDKWFRNSLLNQGFDTRSVDLATDPLNDIDILVISDLREPLSDAALEGIRRYYECGGNMFISGDYQRSENMNRLTEMLGVEFSDGVLVEESDAHNPTIVSLKFTEEAAENYFTYTKLKRYGYEVSGNTATALDYTGASEKGFSVIPVLQTRPGAWLEYETTDFIDGEFVCNEAAGERKEERPVLITMSRKVGDRDQRIVVSGDTDIIANGELTTNHPDMNAQNYAIIKGSFRWLSEDVYPVDIRHPDKTDDEIYLPKGSRKYVKALYVGIIPALLLVLGIVTIVRRQRK